MISGSSKEVCPGMNDLARKSCLVLMDRTTHLVIQPNIVLYSLADMDDKAILQMTIVNVREAAGKSTNMERIGFDRGMDKLLTSAVCISEVVTDGHIEVGALMSKHRNLI